MREFKSPHSSVQGEEQAFTCGVICQIIWWDILLPFALYCGAAVPRHSIWPCFLPFYCILHGLLEFLSGTDLK